MGVDSPKPRGGVGLKEKGELHPRGGTVHPTPSRFSTGIWGVPLSVFVRVHAPRDPVALIVAGITIWSGPWRLSWVLGLGGGGVVVTLQCRVWGEERIRSPGTREEVRKWLLGGFEGNPPHPKVDNCGATLGVPLLDKLESPSGKSAKGRGLCVRVSVCARVRVCVCLCKWG